MTQMLDTEGKTLPNYNGKIWDLDLCDWNDGRGPMLTLDIPNYFEVPDEGGKEQIYDSEGVITVSLRDVMEEYLQRILEMDGGDGALAFAAWLRDYANRLESELASADEPQEPPK